MNPEGPARWEVAPAPPEAHELENYQHIIFEGETDILILGFFLAKESS